MPISLYHPGISRVSMTKGVFFREGNTRGREFLQGRISWLCRGKASHSTEGKSTKKRGVQTSPHIVPLNPATKPRRNPRALPHPTTTAPIWWL